MAKYISIIVVSPILINHDVEKPMPLAPTIWGWSIPPGKIVITLNHGSTNLKT